MLDTFFFTKLKIFLRVNLSISCIKTGVSSDILTAVLVELAEFHATGYHFIKLSSQDTESFIKDNPVLKPNTIYDVFSEQACKMVDQSFVAGMAT